jgi:hypothetical protein
MRAPMVYASNWGFKDFAGASHGLAHADVQPIAAVWDPAPAIGVRVALLGAGVIGAAVGLGGGSDHTIHKTSKSTSG